MVKHIKEYLIIVIFLLLVIISTTNAKGIEKEWINDFETTAWGFIDYFDLTGKYYNYPEHKRGFKELDDYYLIVLKSSDTTDEILKVSKEGKLIKKISLNNYSSTTENYIIRDNDIIAAREVYENNKYILKLEKYDFDFNVINQKDYEISKKGNQRDSVKIHKDAIHFITFSNDNISLIKYDYDFNKTYEGIKLDIVGSKSVSRETESTLTFSLAGKVYVYDVIKEQVVESKYTNADQAAEMYREEEYNFNGDGRTIGNSYYYKIEEGKYKAYNLNNKFIMENDSFYFYDVHGRLVTSKNGQTNNSFSVYDIDGNYEMDIDMFIIVSDGFLTLKKTSSNKTEISRYKIKYNAKVLSSSNGELKLDKEIYSVNDDIKITVLPNEGYVLGKVKVLDIYGNLIEVNNDLTFKMPQSDVTIEAEFTIPIEENPITGQKTSILILVILCVISAIIITSKSIKFKRI